MAKTRTCAQDQNETIAALEKTVEEQERTIAMLRAIQKDYEAFQAAPDGVYLRVPVPPLAADHPPVPRRQVQLSVSGERSRKAFALLEGLAARDAHVTLGRGTQRHQVRVASLNHVFIYILDNIELAPEPDESPS